MGFQPALYYTERGHIYKLRTHYKNAEEFRRSGVPLTYFPTCCPRTSPQQGVWPVAKKIWKLMLHNRTEQTASPREVSAAPIHLKIFNNAV